MNLIYLSTSTVPSKKANSVHVMKMCNALKKQGAYVELWCSEGNTNCGTSYYEYYNIPDNAFPCRRLKINQMLSKVIPEFVLLSIKAGIIIKKEKPVTDYLIGRSKIAIFMNRFYYHYVLESHIPPKNKILWWIEKKLLTSPNFVRLVVISEELKKIYLSLFPQLKEDQVLVLHDAAELYGMDYEEEIHLNRMGKLNIGYVGHLYPGKCMELMIPIAEKCPEYLFHVVGGTDKWLTYWKNIVVQKHLTNIIFYGYVENKYVNAYYKKFDIVLLPFSDKVYVGRKSEIGSFFSPLKLFEAMGSRKAIVASNLPTIAEVLENGKEGILCSDRDVNEWVKAIHSLEENQDMRDALGTNAYEKMKIYFTWDIRARKFMEIFQEEMTYEHI